MSSPDPSVRRFKMAVAACLAAMMVSSATVAAASLNKGEIEVDDNLVAIDDELEMLEETAAFLAETDKTFRDVDHARASLLHQEEALEVKDAFIRRYPGRFAQHYHPTHDTTVFLVKGDVSEDMQTMLPQGMEVQGGASRSVDEWTALLPSIASSFQTNGYDEIAIAVGVDKIIVDVHNNDTEPDLARILGSRNDLANVDPANVEVVHRKGPAYTPTHTYGGTHLRINSSNQCTAGFVMRDNPSGLYGLVTAGHCFNTMNRYYENSGNWYWIQHARDHHGTRGESGLFHVSQSHVIRDDFYSNTNVLWDVTGMVHQTSFGIGQTYCRYGRTTGKECAVVSHLSAGIQWPTSAPGDIPAGTWIWNLMRVNSGNAGPGDSGGPWYKWNGNAAGIQSGNGGGSSPEQGNIYTYFSTVYHTQIGLNVTLKTS